MPHYLFIYPSNAIYAHYGFAYKVWSGCQHWLPPPMKSGKFQKNLSLLMGNPAIFKKWKMPLKKGCEMLNLYRPAPYLV